MSIQGDPRTGEPAEAPPPAPRRRTVVFAEQELRLISALVVLIGIGLFLALPFVLSIGSVVFLPLVTAIILTIILRNRMGSHRPRHRPNGSRLALNQRCQFFCIVLKNRRRPRWSSPLARHRTRMNGPVASRPWLVSPRLTLKAAIDCPSWCSKMIHPAGSVQKKRRFQQVAQQNRKTNLAGRAMIKRWLAPPRR